MENLSNSGVVPQYIPLHLIEVFTKEDRKIGNGTYGDVYKGIHNGEDIAVKMLRHMPEKDDQKQFKKEFDNIVSLRHENIVRLIAYSYEVKYKYVEISGSATVPCKKESGSATVPHKKEKESKSTQVLAAEIHRALCFEYLQNGSLQEHLYDEYVGLDWPTRYRIIKGTCEALKYLHEELETPVLHLDLKPDNILLDKNMVPKLADFGLSKMYTEEQSRSLQIAEQTKSQMSGAGTIGYMPPEYIDKNEVTTKFDIFSLGVIIIKVMTGSQGSYATSPRNVFIDQVHLNWRKRFEARAAYTTLDEECHQVKTCIETALDCVDSDPDRRPNIGSIVRSLNETENKIEKFVVSLPHDEPIKDTGPLANKALVRVNQQQLCYSYPIEPNKRLASSLQLENMTDGHVAYIFVVCGEVEYSSTRAKGIISPRSTWEVVLSMKAHNVSALQWGNKVILWSTIVSKDLKPNDITLGMFKQTDRIVDEIKLDVVAVRVGFGTHYSHILQRLQELCIRRDSIFRELEMLEHGEKTINLSLQLLQLITDNFSDKLKIGFGGRGAVYKGILRYGTVAVKKLFNNHTNDDQMFYQEVINMISVKHQNVVQLLGYCSHTEERAIDISGKKIMVPLRERLLCFEYICNGNLEAHIKDELRGLEWNVRYQIIKGICDGLLHLHLKERIIHMDLKPTNIYLDGNMVPKIGDFGLSRLDDQAHTISGDPFLITLGYCAPEYNQGEVSVKSDIYSLGIIILEIVTGSKEKPIISKVLKKWRHRWNKRVVHKPLWYKQVTNCLNLALSCTCTDPRKRPDIRNIIHELQKTDSMDVEASGTPDEFQELGDMLGVDPLTVHLSVDLNEQTSWSVELTNSTDDYFAFRISTNSLSLYDIHPSKGIVAPRSKCSVTITLHALEKAPYHSSRTDEFSVQSTKVDGSLTIMDSEKTGNEVDEVNLIVILDVCE